MDVILLKELKKKGNAGDVITVSAGYAANYLIPMGFAVPSTKEHVNNLTMIKKKEAKRLDSLKSDFEKAAQAIMGKTLEIKCKTNKGVLYGSVTPQDVSKHLASQFSVTITKQQLNMPDHIKTLGSHDVTVNLHPDVPCSFTLKILGDTEVEEPTTYEEAVALNPELSDDDPVAEEDTEEPEVAQELDVSEESDDDPVAEEDTEEPEVAQELDVSEDNDPPSDQ